jgi:type II secretory pathway component GspD/PulD (secretin)
MVRQTVLIALFLGVVVNAAAENSPPTPSTQPFNRALPPAATPVPYSPAVPPLPPGAYVPAPAPLFAPGAVPYSPMPATPFAPGGVPYVPMPTPLAVAPVPYASQPSRPNEKPSAEASLLKKLQELAPPPALKNCAAWHKRVAIHLSHIPATDAAAALNKFFANDGGLLIVPEPVTNTLLISAVPGALEEVQRLVKELDRPQPMVSIDAAIVEVRLASDKEMAGPPTIAADDIDAQLAALKKRGEVQILGRPRVMTLENQPAYLQVGAREPVNTEAATAPRGGAHAASKENMGVILGVTPRIADDGTVVMEIDIEKSQPAPAEGGAAGTRPKDGATGRSRVEVSTAQATISVPDGRTVVLGGMISQGKPQRTELVFLVSARVIRPETTGSAVPATRARRSQ